MTFPIRFAAARCRAVLLALAVALPLAGPVSAKSYDYWPERREGSMRVEVRVPQHEIKVDVGNYNGGTIPPPTGGGFAAGAAAGAIGALIEIGINEMATKAAAKNVAPIRDLLLDYDLQQKLEDAVRERVHFDALSAQPEVVFLRTDVAADAGSDALVAGDDIVVVFGEVSFSPKFEQLHVRLVARMVDRKAGKKVDAGSMRLLRTVEWTQQLPRVPAGGDRSKDGHWVEKRDTVQPTERNVERLVAMGKERLAAAIDHGIQEAASRLDYDLGPEGRAERAKGSHYDKYEVLGIRLRGRPVETLTAGGSVFRTPTGVVAYEPMLGADPAVAP